MAEGSKSVPSLLPLEYCSISRAARLLSCEQEDLWHLIKIGSLKLCINMDELYFRTRFSKSYSGLSDSKWEPALVPGVERKQFSPYCSISRLIDSDEVIVHGIWQVTLFNWADKTSESFNQTAMCWITPYSDNESFGVEVEISNFHYVNVEELASVNTSLEVDDKLFIEIEGLTELLISTKDMKEKVETLHRIDSSCSILDKDKLNKALDRCDELIDNLLTALQSGGASDLVDVEFIIMRSEFDKIANSITYNRALPNCFNDIVIGNQMQSRANLAVEPIARTSSQQRQFIHFALEHLLKLDSKARQSPAEVLRAIDAKVQEVGADLILDERTVGNWLKSRK